MTVLDSQTPPRRIMLKISGAALAGDEDLGIDPTVVQGIAKAVAKLAKGGVQVCITIGGGNMFRGALLAKQGIDRSRGDYMGMLSTVINDLALQDFLEKEGAATRVQTAITMGQVAEPYIPRRAIRHLEKGRVVIFGAGLGAPFFSTDTAAAQRALETSCEILLMAKNGVQGVYSADPSTDPSAVFFSEISYQEVLTRELKVADATAISLCSENGLPIRVFGMDFWENIYKAGQGDNIGTLISARND